MSLDRDQLAVLACLVALTGCGATGSGTATSDTLRPSREAGTSWQGVLSQWQRRKVHLDLWLWLDGEGRTPKVHIRASLHRAPANVEVSRYESLGMRALNPYEWVAEVDRVQLLRLVQEPAVHHVKIDEVFQAQPQAAAGEPTEPARALSALQPQAGSDRLTTSLAH